jgi:hypothetical protein
MSASASAIRRREVRWVVLSTAGLAAGLALGLGLGKPVQAVVGMMLVTPVVLAIAGSVLGASQSLAMGWGARSAALWIGTTALGVALGMTLGIVVVEAAGRSITGAPVRLVALGPLARLLGLTVVGSVTGLAVGLAQRISLRQHPAASKRWVAVSVIGFGIGLPGGGVAADLLLGGLRTAAGVGLFLTAAGLITGIFTARSAARIALALEDGIRAA